MLCFFIRGSIFYRMVALRDCRYWCVTYCMYPQCVCFRWSKIFCLNPQHKCILAIRYDDEIRPKNFLPRQQCQCPNVADDPPKFVSRTLHSIISLFHQTYQCTTIPRLHVILLFHRPVSFVFVVAVLGLFSLRIIILVWPCWGCLVCMLPLFWSSKMFYYLPIVPTYILHCCAMLCNVDVTT